MCLSSKQRHVSARVVGHHAGPEGDKQSADRELHPVAERAMAGVALEQTRDAVGGVSSLRKALGMVTIAVRADMAVMCRFRRWAVPDRMSG